ncbi:MAG TPA: AAC(3) family N-acetyltransferase [Anaerolineales bacterium]|nr:AAC(3) family N-acetyltransferase [Anaerolineales bacterium]
MVEQAQIRPASKVGGLTYNQIARGLRAVGLNENSRVVVHASLSSFGHVHGGAQTVVGALAAVCGTVIAPAFTYQTLLVPKVGPVDNGMVYAEEIEDVEFWRPDLPVHPTIGTIPNAMLKHPAHKRSRHPALSFVGIGRDIDFLLASQTLDDPFAPLAWLADNGGDVLLLGVTHRTNTMIHVGEWRAGRKPFVRWSLTAEKILEFNWPGDSGGFDAITPHIQHITIRGQIGQASAQRIPAGELVVATVGLIRQDPTALLCHNDDCERCRDLRKRVQ